MKIRYAGNRTGNRTAGIWMVFLAVLSCILTLPGLCFALNTVAQYGGAYTGWPLESQWQAVSSLNDPIDLDQATWGHIDFVGDSTDPAVYTYYNGSYLFFRVRVHHAGDCTTAYDSTFDNGTIMVVISTNTSSPTPAYAFAWDFKENDHTKHGLEMTAISTTGGSWGATTMNDVDGKNAAKDAPPDFALTGGDGYIRTLDHQPTTNFGDTLFVDFAVSCSYLTASSGTGLACDQTWKITAASVQNANDHGFLGGDIAGNVNPTSAPTTGWSGSLTPTLAVVNAFQAHEINGTTLLTWETSSEIGTAGFNVYAVDPETGKLRKVNSSLIPALLESPQGGTYSIEDSEANQDSLLTYLLEELEVNGSTGIHRSCRVSPEHPEIFAAMDQNSIASGAPYSRIPRAGKKRGRVAEAAKTTSSDVMTRQAPAKLNPFADNSLTAEKLLNRVKIGVRAPGLYRVTAGEIAPAFNISEAAVRRLISARRLQLSNQGRSVGILSAPDSSAIYFYGQALDTPYTNTNVYWLSHGAATVMPSKRLHAPTVRPGSAFLDYLHVEKDLIAWPRGVSNAEDDFWLWDYIYAEDPTLGSRQFVISADGATGSGHLTVNFRGLSEVSSAQDHYVRVQLNGTPLGEDAWDGLGWHSSTFEIPPGTLVDGNNTVELTAVLGEGVPYSLVGVDSFDLAYKRHYRAVSDQLLSRGDLNRVVQINGFSSPLIWLLDLSKPRVPSLITKTVTGGGVGRGWVRFRPESPTRSYLAATAQGALTPAYIQLAPKGNLKARQRVDYLIITAPELRRSASSLAAFQSSRGLKSFVVTTDDIYNHFSHGIRDPHAIRAFLKFAASQWQKAPEYVVFAGDGSYDYKNSLGFNDSLVPPLMTLNPWGLTPSDGLLADIAGDDGIPDIAFGRIPAQTESELKDYVTKLKTNSYAAPKAIFLADNPDSGGDFSKDSDYIIGGVDSRYTIEKIYLSELSLAVTRGRLVDAINQGASFLNYFGHASYERLASEGVLTKDDIPGLTNSHAMPVVLGMTCLLGQFGLPGVETLGETLVLQRGRGAIGIFGSTGPADDDDSKVLNAELWHTISGSDSSGSTLGKVILKTLRNYAVKGGAPYMVQTYTFLGDPAVEVK